MKKIIVILIYVFFINLLSAQILVNHGSSWKYSDDGNNQKSRWRELSYDDTGWSVGNAQLGYGDGDENTEISYGNSSSNKHICYYFRKTFNVSDPNANTALKISLLKDDSAVVYINGTEIVRSNMPSDTITFTSLAASAVASSSENTFFEYYTPASILNSGQNLIAVEVHQKNHSSSDLSFDLELEFSSGKGVNYDYYKLPYLLYTGNNNEMLIMWQMKSTVTCDLLYGTDTTYSQGSISSTEYNNYHQHKVLLTGLSPDQKYYYKVVYNNTDEAGSFQTAPQNNAQNLAFFAYGDTRSNPNDHDDVAKRIMQDISQNNLKQTFIINSGDLVYDGDSEASWQNEFFNQQYSNITDMLGNLPYLAAIGNHEGQGVLFSKYFDYPMYVNNYYYSFDYGPVHIIVIDVEGNSPGSTQYNWIVNDLSSSTKAWKVAIFHEPAWSAGGHSNNSNLQNILQPLFEQYGVQMAITGHNHYYARAVVNDVHHITTGGGGAPLYTPSASYPNIVTVDESNHYCKIEITGDSLHFSAIRSNNSIIEDFYIGKNQLNIAKVEPDNEWLTYTDSGRIIVNLSNNHQSGVIEIYDNIGKKISEKNITNQSSVKFSINKKGVFFVRYLYNGKQSTKKVIVLN